MVSQESLASRRESLVHISLLGALSLSLEVLRCTGEGHPAHQLKDLAILESVKESFLFWEDKNLHMCSLGNAINKKPSKSVMSVPTLVQYSGNDRAATKATHSIVAGIHKYCMEMHKLQKDGIPSVYSLKAMK